MFAWDIIHEDKLSLYEKTSGFFSKWIDRYIGSDIMFEQRRPQFQIAGGMEVN